MEDNKTNNLDAECPVCGKHFEQNAIEVHVNRCIFLNTNDEVGTDTKKRPFSIFSGQKLNSESSQLGAAKKKAKSTPTSSPTTSTIAFNRSPQSSTSTTSNTDVNKQTNKTEKSIPLAEKMRPQTIEDYIGQSHVMGKTAILRKILDNNETPSMILWGPPGVGKTTLAHVIANRCKQTENTRFVKLSATMAGVNDIKTAVATAKNELKFGRKTILFMDEIHRFNKLQQVNQVTYFV